MPLYYNYKYISPTECVITTTTDNDNDQCNHAQNSFPLMREVSVQTGLTTAGILIVLLNYWESNLNTPTTLLLFECIIYLLVGNCCLHQYACLKREIVLLSIRLNESAYLVFLLVKYWTRQQILFTEKRRDISAFFLNSSVVVYCFFFNKKLHFSG